MRATAGWPSSGRWYLLGTAGASQQWYPINSHGQNPPRAKRAAQCPPRMAGGEARRGRCWYWGFGRRRLSLTHASKNWGYDPPESRGNFAQLAYFLSVHLLSLRGFASGEASQRHASIEPLPTAIVSAGSALLLWGTAECSSSLRSRPAEERPRVKALGGDAVNAWTTRRTKATAGESAEPAAIAAATSSSAPSRVPKSSPTTPPSRRSSIRRRRSNSATH